MSLTFRVKDPTGILSYTADYTPEIAGDPITAAPWTIPAGLTSVQQSFTVSSSTVKISGGTLGSLYECICSATGTSGQVYVKRLFVLIEPT